jgi:putative transposase
MARAPREEFPGGLYHVAARGNSGQDIYFDDRDRRHFFWRLDRVVQRHRWLCLAYCLMSNHFHLVLHTPDGGLSPGMQELLSGYSRTTNQRYGRRDHLFRQHFFSVRLKRDPHLLEVSRYVVLNPVRAGICEKPESWRWSSYRASVGLSFVPPFLAVHELLRFFGPSPEKARLRYEDFVASAPPAVSDTVTGA